MSRIARHEETELDKYNKIRKKAEKERGLGRAFLTIAIIAVLIVFAACGVYAAVCISKAPNINPKAIYENINLSSTIYDDDEKQIDSVFYYENRNIVKYKDMPENLKNAFIAIEDKTFWKHHGFNFKRMVGAVLQSLIGRGDIRGTSTITQQLARNVYLADTKSERTIKRKIIEMYYANQIEHDLSKEEILEAYLNSIYLGYGCYGVNAAARTYFSSSVKDLTLEECAALAALPQAPDSYALIKTEKGKDCTEVEKGIFANDISKDRRELVLDLMTNQELITKEQATAAKKPLKDFLKPNKFTYTTSFSSYYKDYLITQVIADLMQEYDMIEEDAANMVYTKGLKIYSTMDSKAQKVITEEFKKDNNFPLSVNGKYPQAAMVITDVEDGSIKAMVGGRKPKGEFLFNRAINTRQPGSSIKPLSVYGAALQKSFELQQDGEHWKYKNYGYDSQGTTGYGNYITAGSTVYDEVMHVNGQIWPYNSNGRFTGYNTFRTAIQDSINTCAVKIQIQVGTEYSAKMLEKFGLTSIIADDSKPYNDMNAAAMALGGLTNGVSPLEMSLAYAAFVNGGYRNTSRCYTTVVDRNGRTLLEKNTQQHEAIDEGVAWIMMNVLQSVVTDGIATPAAVKGIKVGGKTGTTNDQYDIWFDGFTPRYSASLWIGTDDNVSLTQMSGPAAALWGKIMKQIPKALKGEYREMPANVTKVNGEYYTKGTEPGYFSNENVLPKSKTRTKSPDEIVTSSKKNDKKATKKTKITKKSKVTKKPKATKKTKTKKKK